VAGLRERGGPIWFRLICRQKLRGADMTNDELAGRIRAIEAVLIELRELTPDLIDAAKASLRDPKGWHDPREAEVRLQISGHLDVHAEKALDDLKRRKTNK
jgi:hypothetical protein